MVASQCANAAAVEAFLRRNGAFDQPTSPVASLLETRAEEHAHSKRAHPLLHSQRAFQPEPSGGTSLALLDVNEQAPVMAPARLVLDRIRPSIVATPLDHVAPCVSSQP
jgi:hypothetical protein